VKLKIRRLFTIIDEKWIEADQPAEVPLRKVAGVLVIENPYVGRFIRDLQPMIEASVELGERLAIQAVEALKPYTAQSYGKGGIVGLAGEQEHANAVLTTAFANPIRNALGGGDAWVSSMTKVAAPGTPIDVPMNCKDEIYVRSHYDGMTISLEAAPLPDEIAVILCLASRGRLNARVGGLSYEEAQSKRTAKRS
jgi:hypothetical protein